MTAHLFRSPGLSFRGFMMGTVPALFFFIFAACESSPGDSDGEATVGQVVERDEVPGAEAPLEEAAQDREAESMEEVREVAGTAESMDSERAEADTEAPLVGEDPTPDAEGDDAAERTRQTVRRRAQAGDVRRAQLRAQAPAVPPGSALVALDEHGRGIWNAESLDGFREAGGLSLSAPQPGRRVALAWEGSEDAAPELRWRDEETQGWSTWQRVDVAWSEGNAYVGRVDAGGGTSRVDLRGLEGLTRLRVEVIEPGETP